ncbi:nucleoporin-62 C-terminal-like protein [Microcaecilia unicolor]|uniref:Nuclear pore glycoprotein p62 n=1 Tax=Microcaecilia unicolor TaxID=1415580 RepID=A0A6P7YF69_9AMPH|nr:nucleoporin-62 C-terminal-like protein [Microcaecilia unicolor]XP_030066080.1 nucleoporin-62 C-terminal-like protein [Microcaecilia unicolor]XP_030066081.1 nucleoporin-62 C-terminal-like protein [Microcaecilia unicolor]XP_030066082.1 nucleoporin-62 C-terminal-like protein [Microcaecilia unicolor]XP_030066083.1 nucleoporin-62 C-terminal-like protein [Microcaecilia unicolor]
MSGFNFGESGSTGGGFSFGTPKTTNSTSTAAAAGFSFSAPGTTGGFSFGTPTQPPATTQSGGLFSLSTSSTPTQMPGFSFGTQTTSASTAATVGFSLGANPPKINLGGTTTSQPTGVFGLANSTPSSSLPVNQNAAPSGFSFGTSTTPAQPAANTGFTFSTGGGTTANPSSFAITTVAQAVKPAASTGLIFGTSNIVTTAPGNTQSTATFQLGQTTGLGFGMLSSAAVATTATPASIGIVPASTVQGPGLQFGTKLSGITPASTGAAPVSAPASTLTSLLGPPGPTLFASISNSSTSAIATSTVTPSTASAGLPLGGTLTTGISSLGTPGFGLKVPGTVAPAAVTTTATTSTTSSSGFSLNIKPTMTVTTSSTSGTAAPSTSLTSTTSTPSVMTYAQLENLINKWSLELEDQEKYFLHQATQVNAWDRTLIENGEKITTLHREVEKVKLDQKRLDQELDFILSQQKELEDLLNPLEESMKEQSGTIYLQHADEEREKTYKLAENIDAQLKRMAQDLKDIIEHLNTSGGPADTSDPLQQICKILNAHMDSLQWIDQNSALLQRKVEEVTKVCESRRKEQERSFRIAFD